MKKLGAINGLRGLAILGVIWHHLFWRTLTPPGVLVIDLPGLKVLPLTLFSNGWLGVNLFFILSGFVLYYPFASSNRQMSSAKDCWSFYARRAKRLMPLFWISLAVLIVVDYTLFETTYSVGQLLLYFTATFNFTAGEFSPAVNWVLWSLGIEIWFSALFPLLLVLFRRYDPTRLLLLVLVLSLAVRIYANQWLGNVYLNPLKDSLPARLDDFVVGMWLCHMYVNAPRKAFPATALFAYGVATILLVCTLWDLLILGEVGFSVRPILNNLFQLGAAAIIYAALISDPSGFLRWFSSAGLQVIGLMTYSIYVWHGRLLKIMADKFGVLASENPVDTLIYLGVLLVISIFSYRFIEFGHVRDTKRLFRSADG